MNDHVHNWSFLVQEVFTSQLGPELETVGQSYVGLFCQIDDLCFESDVNAFSLLVKPRKALIFSFELVK